MPQSMSFIFLSFLFLSACHQPSNQTQRARKSASLPLVKVAAVRSQPLTTTGVYTGHLQARHFIRIFAQEPGYIIHLPYFEGDRVNKDTLLVQLDDRLLLAELDKAIAVRKQTQVNVQRLQKLARKKMVSADELLRAQTERDIAQAEEKILRTRLSYMHIKAPFTGLVTARLAEMGDVISGNTPILTIIDPLSLIIVVQVSEWVLSQLQLKEPVSVHIDALGATHFAGYISRIYPTIQAQSHLGQVEVTLQPLPKGVREGQFCRVTIEAKTAPRLTLPYSALRRDQAGEYVFILDTEQKVQRQPVRSGLRLANKIEIIEGVNEGQFVIKKGFLGLESGQLVQVVE